MARSKIEWLRNPIDGSQGYSINPVKGLCPVACTDNQGKEYCYARRMYKRFKWNPEIRIMPLLDIKVKEGSRIFVGSTIELFGEWVKQEWLEYIFKWVRAHSQHTFIFLTKQPQNLIKWSPFPKNCWVGVSVTDSRTFERATYYLRSINAKTKCISFEPLLGPIGNMLVWLEQTVNWVIIGQQTPAKKATMPSKIWIDEIEDACRKAGIPYFEKNNLQDLLGRDLIQQFPKGVSE